MSLVDQLVQREAETGVRIPPELEAAFNAAVEGGNSDAVQWRYEQIMAHLEGQWRESRTSSERASSTQSEGHAASSASGTEERSELQGTPTSPDAATVGTSRSSASHLGGDRAAGRKRTGTRSNSGDSTSGEQQALWSES